MQNRLKETKSADRWIRNHGNRADRDYWTRVLSVVMGEKQMDSGYILKVELIGCLDGLDLDGGERNKKSKGNSEMFYLNWVNGSIIYRGRESSFRVEIEFCFGCFDLEGADIHVPNLN